MKNITFLIIHGIGEQSPYETLDGFSNGMINAIKVKDPDLVISHKLIERKIDTEKAIVNFINIKSEKLERSFNIYEYYWAYITEKKITLPQIWGWVINTLNGTINFYKENDQTRKNFVKKAYASDPNISYSKKIRKIRLYLWLSYFLKAIEFFGGIIYRIIPSKYLAFLKAPFKRFAVRMVEDFVGDIAIYTTMDEKTEYYTLRKKILSGSLNELKTIIQDANSGELIIAGHSLGSVIAFDTLNKLNLEININADLKVKALSKIKGIVTFGSPLDKTAFFFRETTKSNEYIRRQIINHLHSFKVNNSFNAESINIQNPITKYLENIFWLNFYCAKDPVSGHLDYYKGLENIEMTFEGEYAKWGKAHSGYWASNEMFKQILEKSIS